MTRITNAVLNQKIDDVKEVLNKIEGHIQRTDDHINGINVEIESIKTRQKECPARNNYKDDKKDRREFLMWVPSAIAVGVSILSFIMSFIN